MVQRNIVVEVSLKTEDAEVRRPSITYVVVKSFSLKNLYRNSAMGATKDMSDGFDIFPLYEQIITLFPEDNSFRHQKKLR